MAISKSVVHRPGSPGTVADPVTLVAGDDIDVTYDANNATLTVALAPDFPDRYWLQDHFLRGATSSGVIGELGWLSAGTITQLAASSTLHGAVQLATAATASTVAVIFASNQITFHPSATFDARFRVRVDTVDANTQVRVGFGSAVAFGSPANGVYFEKLAADTNWFASCRSSSTETRTSMGVAPSTSFATLRVRRVNASTIGFSINGGAEVEITTNIPSSGLIPFVLVGTATTASRTAAVDWFDCLLDGMGAA